MSSDFLQYFKAPKLTAPLCAETDPEIFFINDEDEWGSDLSEQVEAEETLKKKENKGNWSYSDAKKICDKCPDIVECAKWSIEHELYGFWAGMTPNQRRTARRRLNIKISIPY